MSTASFNASFSVVHRRSEHRSPSFTVLHRRSEHRSPSFTVVQSIVHRRSLSFTVVHRRSPSFRASFTVVHCRSEHRSPSFKTPLGDRVHVKVPGPNIVPKSSNPSKIYQNDSKPPKTVGNHRKPAETLDSSVSALPRPYPTTPRTAPTPCHPDGPPRRPIPTARPDGPDGPRPDSPPRCTMNNMEHSNDIACLCTMKLMLHSTLHTRAAANLCFWPPSPKSQA